MEDFNPVDMLPSSEPTVLKWSRDRDELRRERDELRAMPEYENRTVFIDFVESDPRRLTVVAHYKPDVDRQLDALLLDQKEARS